MRALLNKHTHDDDRPSYMYVLRDGTDLRYLENEGTG